MTRPRCSATTVERPGEETWEERRARGERRRNSGGLFERRARRSGVCLDRRRPEPDNGGRLRALWRRVTS